jgi:ABC-type cobalamin/Fe3+-siderophores transport system ATPase subunit
MKRLTAAGIVVEKGGRRILDEAAIDLPAGEFVGIIGPNGSGKSTLLRVLARLEPTRAGRVSIDEIDLSSIPMATFARRVGYHAQNPQLHWPLPVRTIVALGRLPYVRGLGSLGEHDRRVIADAIEQTDLHALLDRRGNALSGGELARVHIARLIAGGHELVLADEPIANLDPRFQLEILGVLRRHTLAGRGAAVVLHDLNIAARHCDRLLLLNEGRVYASGTPREVLTPHNIETVFGVSSRYLTDTGIDQALGSRAPIVDAAGRP